jgi:hypothetical protein
MAPTTEDEEEDDDDDNDDDVEDADDDKDETPSLPLRRLLLFPVGPSTFTSILTASAISKCREVVPTGLQSGAIPWATYIFGPKSGIFIVSGSLETRLNSPSIEW